MKILVDIGNSNTSIAFSQGDAILRRIFIKTSKKEIDPSALKRLFGERLAEADEMVIVEVVPRFLTLFKKSIAAVAPKLKVRLVGRDIKVPMKIKYRDPSQVGQDRLVTSFGAYKIYGAPLIVVDFGTAVTFDCVGPDGSYEGGLIFPGLRIALETLSLKAALLPRIEIEPVKEFLGRDTVNSINSGVLFGFAGACDGIIKKLKTQFTVSPKVIGTGGDAGIVARYAKSIDTVNDNIIFHSLAILAGE